MGLFDKIKSVKNFITGGSAEVDVSVIEPSLDNSFQIQVHAQIKEQDLNIKRVYIHLYSEESIQIDVDFEHNNHRFHKQVTRHTRLHNETIEMASAQHLKAGERYEWMIDIQLPDSAEPTYYGRHAEHHWYVEAGLDVPGNDPDSNPLKFEMY